MSRVKVKLSTLIDKMLKIEHDTGIKLTHYSLYDKVAKESITIQNYERYADYYYAFNHRTSFDYLYNDELDKNPIEVLRKNNGRIYVPVCLKNQQKAYVFQFSVEDIRKARKEPVATILYEQVYEQLRLPLEEMGGVVYA